MACKDVSLLFKLNFLTMNYTYKTEIYRCYCIAKKIIRYSTTKCFPAAKRGASSIV